MSIETIVTRLIGEGEQGDRSPPLAPGASYALSQRLRAMVAGDTGGAPAPDCGTAEEALKLACYLDGTMDASERAAYERALAGSPERRDDLVSAAAWLAEIEAKKQAPPAELTALALALDDARPARIEAARPSGFVAFLERLFPGPRLAVATSAIASVAIVAVGLDIALHVTNPGLAPSHQVAGVPSTTVAHPPRSNERPWVDPQTRNPEQRPMVYAMPPGHADLALNRELMDAVLAYRKNPTLPQRQQLLAALARAGLTAEDARRVETITVQQALYEQLALGAASPVASILTQLTDDGRLVLDVGRLR